MVNDSLLFAFASFVTCDWLEGYVSNCCTLGIEMAIPSKLDIYQLKGMGIWSVARDALRTFVVAYLAYTPCNRKWQTIPCGPHSTNSFFEQIDPMQSEQSKCQMNFFILFTLK